MKANKDIWVILEAEGKKLNRYSAALMAEGERLSRQLSGQLHALFVGPPIEDLTEEAGGRGANVLHVCKDERLGQYNPYTYEKAVLSVLEAHQPYLVLALASSLGSDLMPRVAYKRGAALVTNCVDIEVAADGELQFLRPVHKGRLNAVVRSRPAGGQMATMLPESLDLENSPPEPSTMPELRESSLAWEDGTSPIEVIGFKKADHRTMDITEAETIVAVGRGVESKEKLKMIEAFADRIGAVLAGSRPIVDLGVLPYERQIGQTGKRVSPKLIFLIGISGAMEFTRGIVGAGTTVAINIDRQAPVFNNADVGIVGDLMDLTPRILTHIEEAAASSSKPRES